MLSRISRTTKLLHAISTTENKFHYTKACSPAKALYPQNSHFKNTSKICSHYLLILGTRICMIYLKSQVTRNIPRNRIVE